MLGEAIFEWEDDPPKVQRYHVRGASPTSDNHLTSFIASSSTSYGQRDVESISINNILLEKSFSKPGWLSLRLGWPLGRPSTPFGPLGNLVWMDQAFRAEWCHLGIFEDNCATIMWRFLPPLYFLNFFNEWWGCWLLPPSRGFFKWQETCRRVGGKGEGQERSGSPDH